MNKKLVSYSNLADKEIDFYNMYGYLMLPGFINQEYLEDLKKEALEALEIKGIDLNQLYNASDKADKLRNSNEYYENSLLDELINGENTLKLASLLIGGKAIRYFPFVVAKSAGGGGKFHLHQDNNYTQHEPAAGSLNIWVALVDMHPENGCLQIVPGSNKMGVLKSENAGDGDDHRKVKDTFENDVFPVRMRAGDAVAFSRLTVHGSGANLTNEPRIAYALQYHREDVKYMNRKTKQWQKLIENPEFNFEPRKR